MPVIGIPTKQLTRLIGQPIEREELLSHLQHLGCDIEGFAELQRFKCLVCGHIDEITETEDPPVVCAGCGFDFRGDLSRREAADSTDVIRMELLAVRPDMFDPGGLARTVRGYLGIELGMKRYALAAPTTAVDVGTGLANDACYRPFIACAIVRNLHLDDDMIRILMKLQENLHWALGRNRKHASIGVYDLSTMRAPFRYRDVARDELRFVPLGVTTDEASTPDQILANHPKGKAYAHLLEPFSRVPVLEDSTGRVLSMPPIINSEGTKVHLGTDAMLIDVTGTIERLVHRTLNILTTSLMEFDSSIVVEQVVTRYADGREVLSPHLEPQQMTLSVDKTRRLIGVPLQRDEVVECLRKMRHDVEGNDDQLTVYVPAYRNDILHERDLQEDVAIAYGYHNIVPTLVNTMTVGQELPQEAFASRCRSIMQGLGYLEVMTLMLVNPERSYGWLGLQPSASHVVLAHPVSAEQSIVRESLVYGLLETLSLNAHNDLPQRIFDVGKVSKLAPQSETGAIEQFAASAAAIGPRVGFAELKGVMEAFVRELDRPLWLGATEHPTFISGRCAKLMTRIDGLTHVVGILGEVHPQVLENFSLVHPVTLFELSLSPWSAS